MRGGRISVGEGVRVNVGPGLGVGVGRYLGRQVVVIGVVVGGAEQGVSVYLAHDGGTLRADLIPACGRQARRV